jgi:hypothetical protein
MAEVPGSVDAPLKQPAEARDTNTGPSAGPEPSKYVNPFNVLTIFKIKVKLFIYILSTI